MILIKGMEMPKDCDNCPFFDDRFDYPTCNATGYSRGYNWNPRGQRMPDCPLVPVPPHGRLIDADAINHEDEIWKKKCIPPQVVYNAWVVAGEMPTVIPADKDGGA